MKKRVVHGCMIFTLLLGTFAQAATNIVDFTHQDGTHTIRAADVDSLSGDTWNFSDSTLLFDGPETGNDSNTQIYGGLQATWNNTNYTPNLQLRNSDDILQLQVNAGTSVQGLEGILVWNQADFLNLSGETVVFDAASSMSLTIPKESGSTTARFVVNNGGIYYVSSTATNGAGTLTLNNPAAETWAPIYTNDYSVGMYALRTFSDIRSVGIYLKQTASNQTIFQLTDFQVSATTPEIFLVDNFGATPNDDTDDDGTNIQNCINAAKDYANSTGSAVVRFSPGTYHIHDQQRFFTVKNKTGKDCLIIDGNGCTLMNTHAAPMGLNFNVTASENVTIKNMTIRSENCMWVEGEIVAINADGTYDVQLRSDSPAFDAWGTIEQGREIDSYGFAWPCAKGLYSTPHVGGKSHVFVKQADDLGGGRWRVTGFDDGVTQVGDTYAMWNDWTHWIHEDSLGSPTDYQSFLLFNSSNLEIHDITLMTGSKMAIRSTGSSDIVVQGFKTLPDSDRAVAFARDGLNFHDSSNVLIRDCIVGFNGDDIFNGGDDNHNGLGNFIIEDSLFCFSRRHVVLNPVDNFIFRNNIVYYMGGAFLEMDDLNKPNTVLMANNEIYSALRLGNFGNHFKLLDYNDVTLISNRFFECKYRLLYAQNGDNLIVENNHLDRGVQETDQYIARLNNATNTTLTGNTTATSDDDVWIQGSTTLTAESQTAFDHDTVPEFDHAYVSAILGPFTGPQVSAGTSQTIILPDNQVSFTGTAVDHGAVIRLEWTQESGPSTATLSGTNTLTLTASDLVAGTYAFRLSATDDEDNTESATVSVLVKENTAPAITTTTLPNAIATAPYSQQLQFNEGEAPFAWSLTSGSLPDGLTLSTDGVISGTPMAEMTRTFTVRVKDKDDEADDQVLTLIVDPDRNSSLVDFAHLTGNSNFRTAETTTATGSIRSFSDTSTLVTDTEGAGESNTTLYGGLKATWPDGQPDDGIYLLSANDDGVKIQIKDNGTNGVRRIEGLFIWNKADFLNHSTTTVVFNAASSMSMNISQDGTFNVGFVVNDGGTYYVSDIAGESGASAAITNMAAEPWATISTDDNYTIGSYEPRTFTDVQGVGFYVNKSSAANQVIFKFDDFQVSAIMHSEDPLVEWLGSYGLSGPDADLDADLENGGLGDGLNNLLEYALGGDPLVNDAAAMLPVFQPLENHVYYVHNERTDDPALTYTVQISTNLVSNDWKTNGVERVGESGTANNFKTVTNRTDIGENEFMRLIIERKN